MKNIEQNTILAGSSVELRPLHESHFDALLQLATDKRIWEFIPIDMSDEAARRSAFERAITERQNGTQFPFVIYSKEDNRVIGSTRLMDIQPVHSKLEIGWTWLHPDYWATAVNAECKLLLLTFCFETLNVVRVLLKTDENNMRSRKAIEKIGGQFEGVLRKDMIRHNGTYRNSAYFSILDTEWATAKPALMTLRDERKQINKH